MSKGNPSIQQIRDLLEECVAEANSVYAEEHQITFEEKNWTPADLEYVTDELGYKPTRAEWRSAGLNWVGDAHWEE